MQRELTTVYPNFTDLFTHIRLVFNLIDPSCLKISYNHVAKRQAAKLTGPRQQARHYPVPKRQTQRGHIG